MKKYKIEKTNNGRTKIVEGTLKDLKEHFAYTFLVGCYIDKKVRHVHDIKTITSFVNNLQKAFQAHEIMCYEKTYVTLVK